MTWKVWCVCFSLRSLFPVCVCKVLVTTWHRVSTRGTYPIVPVFTPSKGITVFRVTALLLFQWDDTAPGSLHLSRTLLPWYTPTPQSSVGRSKLWHLRQPVTKVLYVSPSPSTPVEKKGTEWYRETPSLQFLNIREWEGRQGPRVGSGTLRRRSRDPVGDHEREEGREEVPWKGGRRSLKSTDVRGEEHVLSFYSLREKTTRVSKTLWRKRRTRHPDRDWGRLRTIHRIRKPETTREVVSNREIGIPSVVEIREDSKSNGVVENNPKSRECSRNTIKHRNSRKPHSLDIRKDKKTELAFVGLKVPSGGPN